MKKSSLFIGIVCFMVFSVAHGQDGRSVSGGTTRNISMGGGPVNPYLVDVSRVHINPALLSRYADYVWGDLGYVNQDAGGGNANFGGGRLQYAASAFDFGKGFAGGMMVNKREGPLYNFEPASADPTFPARNPVAGLNASGILPGGFVMSQPLSPFEILASYSLLSALNVGLSITIAGWSDKSDAPGGTIELSSRVTGFKAGVSHDFGSGSMVDGALLLRLNNLTFKNSAAGANPSEIKTKNGIELGVDGRVIWKFDNKWRFVPIARFYTFSYSTELTPAPAAPSANPPIDYGQTEFEIGLGANYQTERVLIVGGLSFQSLSSKAENKSAAQAVKTTVTQTDLPKINWGLEFSVIEWLIVRGGYFKRLSSTETKTEGATTTTRTTSGEPPYYGDPNGLSAAQQAFTLGLGLHFSGFSFDGTIGEGYFIRGPWPLSGIAQSVFGMVSLNYMW